jgi:hypothetical protein
MMLFQSTLKHILKPYNLVLITVFLSFLAWLVPMSPSIRRGFSIKEEFSAFSFLLLLVWYLCIFLFSYLGFQLGRKIQKSQGIDNCHDSFFYKTLSFFSLLGITITYITIFVKNPYFWDYVANNQANQLKYTLYDNYVLGVNTLRYLTIISSAIAIVNILKNKEVKRLDFLNIVSLFFNSLISSRLSIIMAVVIAIYLIKRRNIIVPFRKVVIVLIITFSVLTYLNYVRNANFYLENYQINNPIFSNVSEILTYLGSPFQVSLGVANNAPLINNWVSLENSIVFLVPTFFDDFINLNSNHVQSYRDYVDVEPTLTTNSVFADMFPSVGYFSFVIISIICFFFSALAGHFSNYDSYVCLVTPIVLYCFAELWRVYLFNAGIIWSLIISLFIPIVLKSLIKPKKLSKEEVNTIWKI